MKKFLLFLAAMFLLSFSASAQNEDLVYSKELKNKADKYDGKSLLQLALCYSGGLGVEKDIYKAFSYLSMANVFNVAEAEQTKDAMLSTFKDGNEKNEAMNKLKKDARHGNKDAKFMYAVYIINKGNEKEGADILLKNAEEGHEVSMVFYTAMKISEYRGIQTTDSIMPFIDELIEKGNPYGMFVKSGLYSMKDSSEESKNESFRYAKMSAELNYPLGMGLLGNLYSTGYGTEKDMEKAFYWFKKAAESGDCDSMYKLANYYSEGEICEKSNDKYIEWMGKASEAGNQTAPYLLGLEYYYGNIVEADDAKALDYFKIAVEREYPYAYVMLGKCYYHGIGTEKDYSKAIDNFYLAAKIPDAEAMCFIGSMFYYGEGVETNFYKAMEWWEKSGGMGYAEANFYLANCYLEHENGLNDNAKAMMYLKRASSEDYAPAMSRLAVAYMLGEDLPEDFNQGYKLAVKAALKLDDFAINLLGRIYEKGIVVDKNKKIAAMFVEASETLQKGDNEKAEALVSKALESIEGE